MNLQSEIISFRPRSRYILRFSQDVVRSLWSSSGVMPPLEKTEDSQFWTDLEIFRLLFLSEKCIFIGPKKRQFLFIYLNLNLSDLYHL